MKRYWLLVVTALFLASAIGLERHGAERRRVMTAERSNVKAQLKEAELRSENAAAEMKEYAVVREAAADIRRQVRWEIDSGRLLQQLGAMAAEAGLRLTSCRYLADSTTTGAIAGGAFVRLKFDVNVTGTFPATVDFIGRIERARQPMVIDSFMMTADRDSNARGQTRLQISCVVPARTPAAKSAPAQPAPLTDNRARPATNMPPANVQPVAGGET